MMKRLILGVAAGCAALLGGFVAGGLAQTPPGPPPSTGFHGGPPAGGQQAFQFRHASAPPFCADGAAWLAGWTAYGEARLRITPEQSKAWQSFVQEASSSLRKLQELCPPSRTAGGPSAAPGSSAAPPAPPPVPGRDAESMLAMQQKMLTARLAAVTQLRAAAATFAPQLSTDQRGLLIDVLLPLIGPPLAGPPPMGGPGGPPRL